MEHAFFLLFAFVAIGSALGVVVVRHPVHSALSLMVCLVQIAAIFILLKAPFLAVIQIFVYVGAVMVLFLFVIMMLDVREAARSRFIEKGRRLALIVLAVLGVELLVLLFSGVGFSTRPAGGTFGEAGGTLEDLSKTLFSDFLLPFELASVVLLVALVGAIVMARKETD